MIERVKAGGWVVYQKLARESTGQILVKHSLTIDARGHVVERARVPGLEQGGNKDNGGCTPAPPRWLDRLLGRMTISSQGRRLDGAPPRRQDKLEDG